MNNSILVKKSTNEISQNTLNLGVTSINVTNKDFVTYYDLTTAKSFLFKGVFVNLDDVVLRLENEKLYLNDSYITLVEGKKYLYIKDVFEGFLENLTEDAVSNIDYMLLENFLNELTTNSYSKINVDSYLSQPTAGCGFWNTYYAYGVGLTEDAAKAEMLATIESGALSGCTQIGGAGPVPFTDGAIWATAFCC